MSGTLVMELQKKTGFGVVERVPVRSGYVPTPLFSPCRDVGFAAPNIRKLDGLDQFNGAPVAVLVALLTWLCTGITGLELAKDRICAGNPCRHDPAWETLSLSARFLMSVMLCLSHGTQGPLSGFPQISAHIDQQNRSRGESVLWNSNYL
jgi:hypothetical protein